MKPKILDTSKLHASITNPNTVGSLEVVKLGNYEVDFVRWAPGTVYGNFVDLADAHMIILDGEIIDGETTFRAKDIITFPEGTVHESMRTDTGCEFVLIWRGADWLKRIPEVEKG